MRVPWLFSFCRDDLRVVRYLRGIWLIFKHGLPSAQLRASSLPRRHGFHGLD